MRESPAGRCRCGCQRQTTLNRRSRTKLGEKKGEYQVYVRGHNKGRKGLWVSREQMPHKSVYTKPWNFAEPSDFAGKGCALHGYRDYDTTWFRCRICAAARARRYRAERRALRA